MYCPNCGTKISLDQKFCRSCGLGLEKIAQSLTEQHHTRLDESLQERKNRLERLGVTALSIFGVGVLGLFLYMVGYKLMLAQGKILAALGLLALIVILGCGLLSVILFAKAKEVEKAATKRRLQQSKEMPEAEATAKLLPESYLEPAPSVTERTTELLFAEKKSGAKRS
jgi:uncharacterized membrane protein YvbJ